MNKPVTEISFSIVIPAYNAARTIQRAIDSCLQQRLPALEIIVVNDGSRDDTDAIIRRHYIDQVKYIYQPQNRGAAHARNVGMKQAKGSYIAFQDADDVWHKDKLQIIAELLALKPQAKFLYHPYTLGNMDFEAAQLRVSLDKYAYMKLLWSNPIGTPCVVLVNDRQLYFNETMQHMEDYDLFLRAGDKYGIYHFPIPLTQLDRPILSKGGLSGNRWDMRKGEFRAYLHLAQRNKWYFLLLPLLVGFGCIKHVVKSFFPPRSNY